MVEIPASAQALLGSDAVAHVWTRNPDGSPQVSVVWVLVRDDEIIFGTDGASRKARNLARDPNLILSIEDTERSGRGYQRHLIIRGTALIEPTLPTATIDATVETPSWQALRAPQGPAPRRVFFVDGVRRIEHRLFVETAEATFFGLLGSFALIPVSLAIIITYTNPILTAVLQSLLMRRMPGVLQLLCLVAALIGVALTIGVDATGADWRGVTLAALASVGFSVSFAWNGYGNSAP